MGSGGYIPKDKAGSNVKLTRPPSRVTATFSPTNFYVIFCYLEWCQLHTYNGSWISIMKLKGCPTAAPWSSSFMLERSFAKMKQNLVSGSFHESPHSKLRRNMFLRFVSILPFCLRLDGPQNSERILFRRFKLRVRPNLMALLCHSVRI